MTFPARPEATPGARMLAEIREQPAVVGAALSSSRDRLRSLASSLRSHEIVVLLGRGSSRSAAMFGATALQTTAGKVSLLLSPASVAADATYAGLPWSRALTVCISQSGESLEILEAVGRLPREANVLGVTNRPDSALGRLLGPERLLELGCGPELAVPATKSYTATLACLLALAYAMADDGPAAGRAAVELPELMASTLAREDLDLDLDTAAPMIVAGEGFGAGVAEESAIKIRETSRAVVVATETSELLHGNINSATAGVGVLAVGTDDLSRRLGEEVLREAEARGAATYRLGMGDRQAPRSVSLLPTVPEWTPFLAMLPVQIGARSAALRRGLDPDAPEGLSKVTRIDAFGS
jgi:glucosamine--fructose-6-phosphate aminotransferase (isomerizing)